MADLLDVFQASYAALAVMTRDLLVIDMWAGQLACEAFNWLLKRLIKQERPPCSSTSPLIIFPKILLELSRFSSSQIASAMGMASLHHIANIWAISPPF